jgi:hypothetical protein
MEFKTSGYWLVAQTGVNANVYVVIVVALWMLACGRSDSLLVSWLRILLVLAVRFLRAGFAAVAPRRSTRRQRRG